MSYERAEQWLKQYHLESHIKVFDVSSATVELAAEALGCEPCRIAKTLSFLSEDSAVRVVAAGDAKVDNKKFKDFFHMKAKMVPADQVEPFVGHGVGGVCPFGVSSGVKVYLDESLKRFETVYPACGSSNSAVELTIPELEQCSGYQEWVDVCKVAEN